MAGKETGQSVDPKVLEAMMVSYSLSLLLILVSYTYYTHVIWTS